MAQMSIVLRTPQRRARVRRGNSEVSTPGEALSASEVSTALVLKSFRLRPGSILARS
jgi:hypothetical protein